VASDLHGWLVANVLFPLQERAKGHWTGAVRRSLEKTQWFDAQRLQPMPDHWPMPMGFDQPDNTTRLLRLGVARWVKPSEFSGERVAPLLNTLLTDPVVTSACAKYAALLKDASALARTCDLLEQLAS